MTIFISQLMNGKTEEEILKERQEIIDDLVKMKENGEIEEDFDIIDSFFKDYPTEENPNVKNVPVSFLAKAVALLSMCDAAYFSKGWDTGRGTIIEHTICEKYEIKILKD